MLKKVCYMKPFTVIEHIPADWDKIDVAIYHGYKANYNLKNKINIKVMSMKTI